MEDTQLGSCGTYNIRTSGITSQPRQYIRPTVKNTGATATSGTVRQQENWGGIRRTVQGPNLMANKECSRRHVCPYHLTCDILGSNGFPLPSGARSCAACDNQHKLPSFGILVAEEREWDVERVACPCLMQWSELGEGHLLVSFIFLIFSPKIAGILW